MWEPGGARGARAPPAAARSFVLSLPRARERAQRRGRAGSGRGCFPGRREETGGGSPQKLKATRAPGVVCE